MSDDGRKIFPIENALEVLANSKNEGALSFMSYAVQREVCEECSIAVAPMVKGWLYTLHPEFMRGDKAGNKPYPVWVEELKTRLGDNVSVPPMEEDALTGLADMLDTMQALKDVAAAKTAEAEEAVAKYAAVAPFEGKAAKLETEVAKLKEQVAQLEAKNKAANADLATAKADLAAFDGKLAVDENDVVNSVKGMVEKALKAALASMPAGGAVAGAAPAAAGATASTAAPAAGGTAAPAEEFGFGSTFGDSEFGFGMPSGGDGFGAPAAEATPAAPAAPAEEFGFGASGASGDGFGF